MNARKTVGRLLWAALFLGVAGLITLSPVMGMRFFGAMAPLLGLPTPPPYTPQAYGPALLTQSAQLVAADGLSAATATHTPTLMPASTPKPSPTTRAALSSAPAGMLRVPAGTFVM